MNDRLKFVTAAFLAGALLTGAYFWLDPSRRPEVSTLVAARESTDPATTGQSPTTSSETHTPEATTEAVVEETPEVPELVLPGPVTPMPKPIALAAVDETPAGPETGPALPPVTVLENMRAVFRQYCARLGGNPIGNNPEITAALNGGNPRQVVFLNPEDGTRINHRGELIDNWGTPFFFHQISRTQMEIRSAGPDRKMWTADDLAIK